MQALQGALPRQACEPVPCDPAPFQHAVRCAGGDEVGLPEVQHSNSHEGRLGHVLTLRPPGGETATFASQLSGPQPETGAQHAPHHEQHLVQQADTRRRRRPSGQAQAGVSGRTAYKRQRTGRRTGKSQVGTSFSVKLE